MDNNVQAQSLKRTLGLAECVTITAGAVIGVGLFTVGSQIVGLMGGTVIVASLISFILVLFPCAMYGELGAALPLAGGTYSFAKRSINYGTAVFESWNYTLAQIGIGASESMAFSNYFVRLLNALGMKIPVDDSDYSLIDLFQGNADLSLFLWKAMPAVCLFILFTVISYRGAEVNGRTQNFFMFFFWACSLVWFGLPRSLNVLTSLVLRKWLQVLEFRMKSMRLHRQYYWFCGVSSDSKRLSVWDRKSSSRKSRFLERCLSLRFVCLQSIFCSSGSSARLLRLNISPTYIQRLHRMHRQWNMRVLLGCR